MSKQCDNKSAGEIIRDAHGIVLIERLNYPRSFALPAGHLDGDDFASCAIRETREEVGITIEKNKKVWGGVIDNPCKREGGSRHEWVVFEAQAWHGPLKEGSDAKRAFWADEVTLKHLTGRTEYFLEKYSLRPEQVGDLTIKIFGDPQMPKIDLEWQENPGLEPVWYFILKKLDII